jgi:signal transduction histidine kinase
MVPPGRPSFTSLLHRFIIAVISICGVTMSPAADPSLPVLTNVAQIKRLTDSQAELGYPARLQGVVTYFNGPAGLAFLQDGTGGTFFSIGSTNHPESLQFDRGDLIVIDGETLPGQFVPSISGWNEGPVKARKLGIQPLPAPRRLEPYELANPVNHSEWVEITGIVYSMNVARERFGTNHLAIEISNSAGSFEAVVHAPETVRDRFTDLLGAVVRCRGIYESISGHFRRLIGIRLLVQDFNDITVVDPGTAYFERLPIRQINSILQFEPGATTRQRVRGTVTYTDPGRGFFMHDTSGALWVDTPQKESVWPGKHVQVVGFPTGKGGFPSLSDAFFEVLGMSNRPPALNTSMRGGVSGIYHGSLVRIRGTVADTLMQPGSQNLLLRADDSFFQVRLLRNKEIPLAELPERGSVLEVTGICFNEFRRKRELATDSEKRFRAVSFHLLLQSPEDIRVISKPPFWSIERVIWATLFLIGALASALAWINALRRQVTRQTLIIEDKIARETVMEERTRIARELHDTLEQELAGIQMQLDAASGHLKLAPDSAKETLDMARALLRHSRHETRRSVWDLRSTALETGNLQRAFAEVLDMVHGESTADIKINTVGSPIRLSTSAENNILRIGQEAVNNSLEHAQSKSIRILLEYHETAITLKITDDGAGFDTTGPEAKREGHFGLIGMRERARKVGGHLEIWSAPGEGTTISLTVPLPRGTTPVRQTEEELKA